MTSFYRSAIALAFIFMMNGISPASAQESPVTAKTIKDVNAQVAALAQKIAAKELDYLEVVYQAEEPTEGVPPSFKFFFGRKDGLLRGCEVGVGHEVWRADFSYYFTPEEKPLKYLEKVSGRPDNPAPTAIIYGSQGEILWKNMEKPRMTPQEILSFFKLLRTRLNTFAG